MDVEGYLFTAFDSVYRCNALRCAKVCVDVVGVQYSAELFLIVCVYRWSVLRCTKVCVDVVGSAV